MELLFSKKCHATFPFKSLLKNMDLKTTNILDVSKVLLDRFLTNLELLFSKKCHATFPFKSLLKNMDLKTTNTFGCFKGSFGQIFDKFGTFMYSKNVTQPFKGSFGQIFDKFGTFIYSKNVTKPFLDNVWQSWNFYAYKPTGCLFWEESVWIISQTN